MVEFKKIVPVLKVSNMQNSVAFYSGVLGFPVAWRAANDGGGENCMLQVGAANVPVHSSSHVPGAAQR